jgi:phosphate starvation-inducible PhoH-like protein
MARKKNSDQEQKLLGNLANFNGLTSNFHVQSKRLTVKQKAFVDLSLDLNTNVVFCAGPAGTTKTYVAVYSALRFLSADPDLDLYYVRTVVESADRGLGALPGDIDDKFNPYMAPLDDKLREMVKPTIIPELIQKRRIEAMPINYLRGASFRDKIVIADEAQNFTFQELTTLITRIGENSRLFVCGDFMQSDINGKTGFRKMYDIFDDDASKKRGIHTFEFGIEDIKRSKILSYIIKKIQGSSSV